MEIVELYFWYQVQFFFKIPNFLSFIVVISKHCLSKLITFVRDDCVISNFRPVKADVTDVKDLGFKVLCKPLSQIVLGVAKTMKVEKNEGHGTRLRFF